MIRMFNYFWRHPRRTGFAIFNLLVLGIIVAGMTYGPSLARNGVADMPNFVLGYTALVLLAAIWLGGWLAWAWMVTSRHAYSVARLVPVRSAVPGREAGSSPIDPE
jgi:multidrug resistance efflux pump